MYNFKKFMRKLLPRLGAVVAAIAVGIGLYAALVVTTYKPDNSAADVPFDTEPSSDSDKSTGAKVDKETRFNFLVMGHDRAANLTDVIMLVSYDTDAQSITVMQIPRDTYVELDDYYYHKINGAYNYFIAQERENGAADPELSGCRDLAAYFEKNLAIKIHYCAVMDLDGFEGIVDAIGGVYMYVPMDMYYVDIEQDLYIDLKEGYQRLNGNTAEQFVRFRYGYATGDIGRGNAQKLFMTAFIKQLRESISASDVSLISSLASNVINYVKTDLTVSDMVYFGKAFVGVGKSGGVDLDNVNMLTMPGISHTYDGLSYYIINREATARIIGEYYNIYNINIDSSFDKNKVFVNESVSEIYSIYNLPESEIKTDIYTGDDLDENGLS